MTVNDVVNKHITHCETTDIKITDNLKVLKFTQTVSKTISYMTPLTTAEIDSTRTNLIRRIYFSQITTV